MRARAGLTVVLFLLAGLIAGCGGGGGGGGSDAGGASDGGQDAGSVPTGSSFDLEAAQPCTWVSDASLETVFDATRPEPKPGGLPTTKTCSWEDRVARRVLMVNVTSPRIYDLTAELDTTVEFEGLGRPAILSPSDINDGIMVMVRAEEYSLVIDMSGVEQDNPGLLPLVQEVVTNSGL